MLAWLRTKLHMRRVSAVAERASGSQLERFVYALLVAVPAEEARKEARRLPAPHRETFLLAWPLLELAYMEFGFRRALKRADSDALVLAVWSNIREFGPYESNVSETMFETEREIVYKHFPPAEC